MIFHILGVVPSLNLGTGDLTEEALRVVNIQREADLVALETAKENLERSRREEEEARCQFHQHFMRALFV